MQYLKSSFLGKYFHQVFLFFDSHVILLHLPIIQLYILLLSLSKELKQQKQNTAILNETELEEPNILCQQVMFVDHFLAGVRAMYTSPSQCCDLIWLGSVKDFSFSQSLQIYMCISTFCLENSFFRIILFRAECSKVSTAILGTRWCPLDRRLFRWAS